jgi:hypothetical protein
MVRRGILHVWGRSLVGRCVRGLRGIVVFVIVRIVTVHPPQRLSKSVPEAAFRFTEQTVANQQLASGGRPTESVVCSGSLQKGWKVVVNYCAAEVVFVALK